MEGKKVRFYERKSFRMVLGILLAVILLSNNTLENMSALFAGEQGAPSQGELNTPDQSASNDPAPQPEPCRQRWLKPPARTRWPKRQA